MEITIFDQNRKNIFCCKEFFIDLETLEVCFYSNSKNANGIVLGKYSTSSRCMEILSEIFDVFKTCVGEYTAVYEMPLF